MYSECTIIIQHRAQQTSFTQAGRLCQSRWTSIQSFGQRRNTIFHSSAIPTIKRILLTKFLRIINSTIKSSFTGKLQSFYPRYQNIKFSIYIKYITLVIIITICFRTLYHRAAFSLKIQRRTDTSVRPISRKSRSGCHNVTENTCRIRYWCICFS